MNTYSKYLPNVFLAKCTEQHEKGATIIVNTKYGKEHESIVFNLIYERDGFFYYSIVRADGYNVQERAKAKADRYASWAKSADNKSTEYYNKSNKDRGFLSLGEPIKVGHHSESRHRKAIDQSWSNMGKSVEFSDKAKEHESKSEYWEKMSNTINLSMPESLEYYEYELEKATEYHSGLKSGKYQKEHSYSLTYAKKKLNEIQSKFETAKKLWA